VKGFVSAAVSLIERKLTRLNVMEKILLILFAIFQLTGATPNVFAASPGIFAGKFFPRRVRNSPASR